MGLNCDINRQTIVLHIVKINRMIKTLNYLLSVDSGFIFSNIDPDIMNMNIWIKEILEYWKHSKCPNIANQITNIGAAESISLILESNHITNDEKTLLGELLGTYQDLIKAIKDEKDKGKGSYYLLPDEIANNKAVELLNRSVDAGLLNEQYQPTASTTKAQMKLIAYAVSTLCEIKNIWKPFCELWHYDGIKSVVLPVTKKDMIKSVTSIYPEVIFDKSGSDIPSYYNTNINKRKLIRIFIDLQKSGYISEDSDITSWLSINGFSKSNNSIINWVKDVRSLCYFVYLLYSELNSKHIWEITKRCFTINGNSPNIGTMKSGIQWIKKNNDLSKYEPTLLGIIMN